MANGASAVASVSCRARQLSRQATNSLCVVRRAGRLQPQVRRCQVRPILQAAPSAMHPQSTGSGPLRRPHLPPSRDASLASSMAGLSVNSAWSSGEEPQSSSRMNAEAKAFVPQYQLNPSASVFVPMASSKSTATAGPRSMARNTSQWAQQRSSVDPVSVVEECVQMLCTEPQSFDIVAAYLTTNLNQSVFDHFTLESVVSFLVESSLSLLAFSSLSVHLCCYLESNLTLDFPESPSAQNFRATLLNACKNIHVTHKTMMQETPERVHSFAVFMAHLYTSFTVGQSSQQQRIKALGKAVMELTQTLLFTEDGSNISIGCQVLKMAGHSLESDFGSHDPTFAPLLERIKALLSKESQLGREVTQVVQSVLDMRSNGWRDESFVSDPFNHDGSNSLYARSVSSSSGSAHLTSEEIRFINEQLGNETDSDDPGQALNNIGNSEDDNSNLMDPEIEAAFEEFLASQS